MKKAHTDRPHQTKWIEVPDNLKLPVPFVKATVLRPVNADSIEYEVSTDRGTFKIEIPNKNSHLVSKGQIYDDMCDMDILNEPEILQNLVERYKKGKIFTFIGPTLIVVNPYRFMPEFFSNETVQQIRNKILEGTTSTEKPHIYLIAGNAYNSMIDKQTKQAIVISGESGAGKTESTKYCMQMLTLLSHKQSLAIEAKILACNPILEAFGNSKTIRNDNSSRFGKYVQIYFGADNTITGASINSYLLEKSRVVSAAEKQRSFHIFYGLLASGMLKTGQISDYKYLSKTKCYDAAGISDKDFFSEVRKSMKNIGFTEAQENKIWGLLSTILDLGNLQFDDSAHKDHQSKNCEIVNKKLLEKIANGLHIKQAQLEKILLYERKKFLKEFTLSPYSKNKCIANVNTLSKAIYNQIFEFILFKIQRSLAPVSKTNCLSINILDIFGFENFDFNSFEQFCINYANEKLLKLYNKYVFEREMEILKEDGLEQQIMTIKPPTNDGVITIISGQLSLFSIINDFTLPQQFKDSDIIEGFESKLSKSTLLRFDKFSKTKFIVTHSQCNVKYDIEGFKQKNQDKVIPEISDIVVKLFENESRDQSGKTLLNKFSKEIDELIDELSSSCVHFIRCIKPNEKKLPNETEEKYIITQIRYLGVFETIQIRKKTFPSRWPYKDFVERFSGLFMVNKKQENKVITEAIMKQLAADNTQFLLGNQRVYMNMELQSKLSKKLHEYMRKKIEAAKKIWKKYKKYKFNKQIKQNLKRLVHRIRLWKKIAANQVKKILKYSLPFLKEQAKRKKQAQKLAKNKVLMEEKAKRQAQEKKQKQQNAKKKIEAVQHLLKPIMVIINKSSIYNSFQLLRKVPDKNLKPIEVKDQKLQSSPHLSSQINSVKETLITQTPTKTNNYESVRKTNQQKDSMLNQSIVVESNEVYQRNFQKKQQSSQMSFNENGNILDQSIAMMNDKNILFQSNFVVPPFNPKQSKGLDKLRLVLAEKYQVQLSGTEQDFFSPPSDDATFEVEQTQPETMKEILNFGSKQFFKRVLRKRTNFIGMEKNQDDILVCKLKPLSKSLTMINQKDEKDAIKIFKLLLKIADQAKLQNVFKLIELLVNQCHSTSPQLKNELFLQLIKQSNSDVETGSLRILQTLAVFLHIFHPDRDFILAGLRCFFDRIAEQRFTEKQNQYMRYIFRKLTRKLEKQNIMSYMPIKYQLMALMCKRKITLPVYLSIGTSVLVKVESHENFTDIKSRVMEELGINTKRLLPELFTFHEIVNYDNQELEENPINEKINVWDTISYWEKAKDKYREKGIVPPVFFLMLKIGYIYECHHEDEESIELVFAQCYFEYFVGRIKLKLDELGLLAAIVKIIKFQNVPAPEDYRNCFPSWVIKKYKQQDLTELMISNKERLVSQGLSNHQLKYMFISISVRSPACMSYTINNETENLKYCFLPKRIIILDSKSEVVQTVPLKSIVKYKDEGERFIFYVHGSLDKKVLNSEFAHLCSNYLSVLKAISQKLKADNKVLTGLLS